MIRALRSMGHTIDVIVEKGRSGHMVFRGWDLINQLWLGKAPPNIVYDGALYCHPRKLYINRCKYSDWDELRLPQEKGEYMWCFKKHEVLYLMDMVRRLGYQGAVPDLWVPRPRARPTVPPNSVAIGVGYLKTHPRWTEKHWGNVHYATLATRIYEMGYTPILVGDESDRKDARAIEIMSPVVLNVCGILPFSQTVGLLESCQAYIGNDSGLMHVSAALGIPTLGIFMTTNPVKNRPWCKRWEVLQAPSAPEASDQLEEILREARPDDCLHLQECHGKPTKGG